MRKNLCCLLLCLCCAAWAISAGAESAIDLDLTAISDYVAYERLYEIVSHPEEYDGQIVRLKGWFDYFEGKTVRIKSILGDENGSFAICRIPDATRPGACCGAQELELEIETGSMPENALDWGEDIVVTGRVSTREKDGKCYLYLADARLERLFGE